MARKARATADDETEDPEAFEKALKHLQKWTDTSANKFAVLTLEKEKRAKRFGTMLKLLNSLLENNGKDTKDGICPMSKKDIIEKREKVLEELSYNHLKRRNKAWGVISSVKDYALF